MPLVEDDAGSSPFTVPLPQTSGELITVLAHYHRAEIARMTGWRDRLDRTTNWAITVIAAMLSVVLSTSTTHHGLLLFAMLLVLLLLIIEARRYRFFDVYRNRVRLLEKHYYAHLFAPGDDVKKTWTRELGMDLRLPCFKMTLIEAMGRRLRRNYIWMFTILMLAWLLKITTPNGNRLAPTTDSLPSIDALIVNAHVGGIPGQAIVLSVISFYAALIVLAVMYIPSDRRHSDAQVRV